MYRYMYMYAHICAMPTVSGPPMRSHPVSSKKKPSFANYPACLMSAGSSLSSTSFSLGPRGSCTRLLLFAFVGDIGSERLLEETQQGACEPTTTKQLQQQQKQSGTGNPEKLSKEPASLSKHRKCSRSSNAPRACEWLGPPTTGQQLCCQRLLRHTTTTTRAITNVYIYIYIYSGISTVVVVAGVPRGGPRGWRS